MPMMAAPAIQVSGCATMAAASSPGPFTRIRPTAPIAIEMKMNGTMWAPSFTATA